MSDKTLIRFIVSTALLLSLSGVSLAQKTSAVSPEDQAKANWEQVTVRLFANKITQLHVNPRLLEELAITDSQLAAIKKAGQEQRDAARAFSQTALEKQGELQRLMAAGENEKALEIRREIPKQFLENANKLKNDVQEILSSEKMLRLEQIIQQDLTRRYNPFGDEFGMIIALSDKLELSTAEQKELFDTIVQVRKGYYEKVDQLKSDAKAAIMKTLPAEKRSKVLDLLGDDFYAKRVERKEIEEYRKMLETKTQADH